MKDKATFFERVYEVVRLVPYGRVTTYGDVAKFLGSGKSARMVGWAMNACRTAEPPVPAHRVINRLGMLSGKGHFETPDLMQKLLESEGIQVKEDKVVDFKNLRWIPSEELNDNI